MQLSLFNIKFASAVLLLMGMVVTGVTFTSSAQDIKYGKGLLVTTNGKVVRGNITVIASGYVVELSSGVVTYPFSTIICEARSLEEAYRKQRDAMTRPTAGQHVRLGQWAFEQELFAEAEREIKSALNLQSNNQQAKRLLRHFDARKPKDSEFVDQNKKKTYDQIMIDREFNKGQPLAGLNPQLTKEFASTIHPLLINSCSNSSCHGTSVAHEFRLHPKWNMRGNTRHLTARNLQAVLEQIDVKRPDKSPLITKLNGHHGKRSTNVFIGSRAEKQKRILQNWTLRTGLYLQEQREEQKKSFAELVGHEEQSLQSGGQIQQAGFNSPLQQAEFNSAQKTESSKLESARSDQAYDPFDPEIFNRKMRIRQIAPGQ